MVNIKQIAISLLMLMLNAFFTVTVSYAIIPTFLPDVAGTPAAWAFTILALIPFMIFSGILLLIVARQWGGD